MAIEFSPLVPTMPLPIAITRFAGRGAAADPLSTLQFEMAFAVQHLEFWHPPSCGTSCSYTSWAWGRSRNWSFQCWRHCHFDRSWNRLTRSRSSPFCLRLDVPSSVPSSSLFSLLTFLFGLLSSCLILQILFPRLVEAKMISIDHSSIPAAHHPSPSSSRSTGPVFGPTLPRLGVFATCGHFSSLARSTPPAAFDPPPPHDVFLHAVVLYLKAFVSVLAPMAFSPQLGLVIHDLLVLSP